MVLTSWKGPNLKWKRIQGLVMSEQKKKNHASNNLNYCFYTPSSAVSAWDNGINSWPSSDVLSADEWAVAFSACDTVPLLSKTDILANGRAVKLIQGTDGQVAGMTLGWFCTLMSRQPRSIGRVWFSSDVPRCCVCVKIGSTGVTWC